MKTFISVLIVLSFAVFAVYADDAEYNGVQPDEKGGYKLKAPGRTGYHFNIPSPAANAEGEKLYKLQVKSRPNITVTRVRTTVDNNGSVEGVVEERTRRAWFPLFRRARFVPID